jgi:hypothetical protein
MHASEIFELLKGELQPLLDSVPETERTLTMGPRHPLLALELALFALAFEAGRPRYLRSRETVLVSWPVLKQLGARYGLFRKLQGHEQAKRNLVWFLNSASEEQKKPPRGRRSGGQGQMAQKRQ